MKALIMGILALMSGVCIQSAGAQNTVEFGYDHAGNRTSRTIIMGLRSSEQEPEPETTQVYTEVLSDVLLKIYPNPTDGLIRIEIQNLAAGTIADMRLYSLSGRLITSLKTAEGSAEIDISGQPSGTYLMRIIAGEYRTEWKIIKK